MMRLASLALWAVASTLLFAVVTQSWVAGAALLASLALAGWEAHLESRRATRADSARLEALSQQVATLSERLTQVDVRTRTTRPLR